MMSVVCGKPTQSGLRYTFEKYIRLPSATADARTCFQSDLRDRCYERLSTINKNYRTKVPLFPFLCITFRKCLAACELRSKMMKA